VVGWQGRHVSIAVAGAAELPAPAGGMYDLGNLYGGGLVTNGTLLVRPVCVIGGQRDQLAFTVAQRTRLVPFEFVRHHRHGNSLVMTDGALLIRPVRVTGRQLDELAVAVTFSTAVGSRKIMGNHGNRSVDVGMAGAANCSRAPGMIGGERGDLVCGMAARAVLTSL
jgi:hypothetical protein